jgi:hypothetical protein
MVFSRGFVDRVSGALGSRMYLTLDYYFFRNLVYTVFLNKHDA